ncbi:hypothetical protein MKEN_00325300 [Mycena kentingensis (nom. inval.)]|nr:hypothetical protein MKEN_00325300 [Mycena kentingensis (nom. inval.)]
MSHKPTMYALPPDRRDMPLPDNSSSTPFQSHQSIGQALGPPHGHMNVQQGQTTYSRPPAPPPDGYHGRIAPSQSPPTSHPSNAMSFGVNTNGAAQPQPPQGAGPGPSSASAAAKRKQPQAPQETLLNGNAPKRRREDEGGDDDSGGAGAKHWTDEEKTSLFKWLMAPENDDHWNSLRAAKNSCLRDCALEVFGGKKSYQALKGCYERNFNLFKQMYSFEMYHQANGTGPMNMQQSEADRLREYERRLGLARRGGCEVGNISARVLDHWHHIGWYKLFYGRYEHPPPTANPRDIHDSFRWNGDVGPARGLGRPDRIPDDADMDDDRTLDYSGSPQSSHPMNTHPPPPPLSHPHSHLQPFPSYINPHQTLRDVPQPMAPLSTRHSSPPQSAPPIQTPIPPPAVPLAATTSDQTIVNIPLTQGMISAYLQFLQMQTQTGKQKLEYMRKRDEREERDSAYRRDVERARVEREKAEFEHNKQAANMKQRADRAIEVLGNPMMDASLKQAAGDYLKKLFSDN